jgi:hypothetical protein
VGEGWGGGLRHAEVIGAREPVARRVSFRAPHVEARSADAGPAIPVSSTPTPTRPTRGAEGLPGKREAEKVAELLFLATFP